MERIRCLADRDCSCESGPFILDTELLISGSRRHRSCRGDTRPQTILRHMFVRSSWIGTYITAMLSDFLEKVMLYLVFIPEFGCLSSDLLGRQQT